MDNKIFSYKTVLTRKYRPIKWNDIIGQNEVIIILKNAIKNSFLSQILLFFGPKGVGKNTCAKILSNELNSFSEGGYLNIFEISGFFNHPIEFIFEMIRKIFVYPKKGKYKILIINDIHLFSQESLNLLLKSIEKLPLHVLLIFCCSENNEIIDSIISHSQVYNFKKISLKEIYFFLKKISEKECIQIEKEALFLISQYGNGSISKALYTFDRLTFYEKKKISKQLVMKKLGILDIDYYFNMIDYLLNEKISKILILLNQIFKNGVSSTTFISGLTNHFRNLLLSKNTDTIFLLKYKNKTILQSYIKQSKKLSSSFLIKALMICHNMEKESILSKNSRLIIEIYLIQLVNGFYFYKWNFNRDTSELKNKKIQFLKENWKIFIQKISEKINPIYLNLLKNKIQFQIFESRIILIIPSKLENREFFLIQAYFIKYLRKKLNNPHLKFKTLTKKLNNFPKEQYNFLSKKNKYVNKLIEKLNLKFSSSISKIPI
ncbi:AAA family ATPase [Blattabacterium punctulatus]|uniref:AAA+ ATPase domain-containing protein n=1 Tax=Blattabacterium punctulatus TaxID=164514 RepID=A0ABN5M2Y5_9FLAO|nr:AAA family ATPase [Blattabacterium punctulatus]AWU40062.1 hypothetical protein DM808_02805 [Blattabacterium punctulatus]AWU40604.1 hypothetical protein DM805_02815 [Blattabacterium punctulatus]AWU45062.1 hypothetical protein DM803_02820 [Blattabacterium punctulatus]